MAISYMARVRTLEEAENIAPSLCGILDAFGAIKVKTDGTEIELHKNNKIFGVLEFGIFDYEHRLYLRINPNSGDIDSSDIDLYKGNHYKRVRIDELTRIWVGNRVDNNNHVSAEIQKAYAVASE
jgi:hypothetical protein